jgi:hypothetical protein
MRCPLPAWASGGIAKQANRAPRDAMVRWMPDARSWATFAVVKPPTVLGIGDR